MKLVIHTGPQDDADRYLAALRSRGLDAVSLPAIGIEPVPVDAGTAAIAASHAPYAAVVITSRHAADALPDLRPWVEGVPLFAVGAGTAALARTRGFPVEAVGDAGAEVLADELARRVALRGRTVLFPCGDRARPVIVERLTAAGARVVALVVYRTVRTPLAPAAVQDALSHAAAVIFTSPSGVASFVQAAEAGARADQLRALPVVAIGGTTDEAAAAAGFTRRSVSEHPTPEAVADRVASLWSKP